jgi:hypothetical protein
MGAGMYKTMGILLMIIFGVCGPGVTALAWLCPSLQVDKAQATVAGILGISFAIFEITRLISARDENEAVPVKVDSHN